MVFLFKNILLEWISIWQIFEKYSIISTNEINEYQKSAYFSCQWKIPAENLITDDYFLISSWGWDLDIVKNADTFTSITNRLLYPITDDNYSISLVTADKWLSRYLINENMQSNSLENEYWLIICDISQIFRYASWFFQHRKWYRGFWQLSYPHSWFKRKHHKVIVMNLKTKILFFWYSFVLPCFQKSKQNR